MDRKQARTLVKASALSHLAYILPASMLAGYFFGAWLDGKFGTKFLGVVLMMLGLAAGLIEILRQAQRVQRDFGESDKEKQQKGDHDDAS